MYSNKIVLKKIPDMRSPYILILDVMCTTSRMTHKIIFSVKFGKLYW